jgi:putative transcriptional regulator
MQIPDEMHQTAHGLHGAGLISKRRLGDFDALCRLDVHQMPTQKLKALREDC